MHATVSPLDDSARADRPGEPSERDGGWRSRLWRRYDGHRWVDDRIRLARSFPRHDLDLPLTLGQIAAEAGMSPYPFLRVFRDQTGETPSRNLTRLRVEQARHELAHGSATVTGIARRCGFPSATYLATTFRRQTGVTPAQYRWSSDHSPG